MELITTIILDLKFGATGGPLEVYFVNGFHTLDNMKHGSWLSTSMYAQPQPLQLTVYLQYNNIRPNHIFCTHSREMASR